MTDYIADIHTVNSKQPKAESFAVKNGRFIVVGNNSDTTMLIGQNTKVFDLSGNTIVPGFIDAHIHVLSSGSRHVMAADCDLRSITDVQDALKRRADKTEKGGWVQGFKYDDTKIKDNRF